MRFRLLVAATLFAPTLGVAQTDWFRVASTDNMVWEVKPGSLEISQTKAKVPIAVVIGRISETASKQITVGKWYVSLSDCGREMGKLVTLDIDGKYRYENDFGFGAGSVAAAVAESICAAHSYDVKARDNKGI